MSLPRHRDNSGDAAAGGGMTEIIGPVQEAGADMVPSPALEQAREFIRASKAESTLRGYKSDWRHFCNWSQEHSLCPLPASPESMTI